MKLDKIKFAKLIAFCCNNGMSGGDFEVERLDELTEIHIPEPVHGMVNANDLHTLMALMLEGTRKIDAIKQHRMMTGYGLKESKDAVEKYWPSVDLTIKRTKEQLYAKLNELKLDPSVDAQISNFINASF